MKLSYFSYDFSACCCEAVNAAVCVGTFRCVSAVLLAVLRCCFGASHVLCQAGLLDAPVGGGPPASRPRCEPFARVGCCLWRRWCSGRRMARPPARLGNLTSFGAAPRSPPVPSGPSGALHTGGACYCVLPGQAPPPPTGTAARRLLGPRRPPALTLLIPEPTPNFARNSPTSASSFELRSLELQRFQTLLKLHPIELRATLGGRLRRRPPAPQPGLLARDSSPQARHSSPCSPPSAHTREKTRPAQPKLPKISAFSPAGRTFSRFGPESTSAGRVFSRRWVPQPSHSTYQPPHLKPMTPLRAPWRTRLKPLTPLLPQNSQFQAIFRPQRRRWFHESPAEQPQRRRWFHQASNQGLLVHSKALRRSCLLPPSQSW